MSRPYDDTPYAEMSPESERVAGKVEPVGEMPQLDTSDANTLPFTESTAAPIDTYPNQHRPFVMSDEFCGEHQAKEGERG